MDGQEVTSTRRATLKLVIGALIGIGAFAAVFSARSLGLAGYTQVLPPMMLVGIVIFGSGLHTKLWSGSRSQSRVPPAARPLVSVVATLACWMVASFVLGLVNAVLGARQ